MTDYANTGVLTTAEYWHSRALVFTLGENLKIAGALEAARQQGMRDMLAEVHHLELAYASAMDEAFDEEVTGVHRIAD